MGQKQNNPTQFHTPRDIKWSIDALFEHSSMLYLQSKVVKPIRVLISELESLPPLTRNQQGLHLSKLILHIFCCRNYQQCLFKLLKLFIQSMDDVLSAHSLFVVHPDAWKSLRNTTKLIIILIDHKMHETLNSMFEISNLDSETKQTIARIKMHRLSRILPLVERLLSGEVSTLEELISNVLTKMIQFRKGTLPRSQQTYQMMGQLEEGCFILYLKLYFSSQHHTFLKQQTLNSSLKYSQCLKTATYFLLLGINFNKPSLYDLSALYLRSVIDQKYQTISNAIPSFLFPNLPPCLNKRLYPFLIFHLLYVLTYKSIEQFNSNRILSYQLIYHLIELSHSCHSQIQSFLETLCINTHPSNIEKAYLSKIVQGYLQKTLKTNPSKILSSYLQTSNTYFHLKHPHLKQTLYINNDTVIQSLKPNFITSKKHYQIYTEKYLYQEMFKVTLYHDYSGINLWKTVLKHPANNLKQQTLKQTENMSTDHLTHHHTFKTIDQTQNQY